MTNGSSGVKLKRKVQLRKKVEEIQPPIGPTPEPESPKSYKWIWWVVAVIVLCIIGYFVFSKSNGEQPVQTETEVVEEVVAIESGDNGDVQTEGVQDVAKAEGTPGAAQTEQSADESKTEPNIHLTNIKPARAQSNAIESVSVSNDVESEAMKVIRGDYGVGQERKDKLGEKYQPIQKRVNELKKEGAF